MQNILNQKYIDFFVDNADDFINRAAKGVAGVFSGRPTWFSRQVKNWTQEVFLEPVARVVYSVIMALPFLAIHTFLPYPVNFAIMALATVGRIITIKDRDVPLIFDPISTAIGVVCTAQGIHRMVTSLIKDDFVLYTAGAFESSIGFGITAMSIAICLDDD